MIAALFARILPGGSLSQARPGAMGALALFLPIIVGAPACAEQAANHYIYSGVCMPESHTAEGPIDDDLTQRQSRYYCDSAVLSFIGDYPGHALIQFVDKKSQSGRIIGFGGQIDQDGVMMNVENAYLLSAKKTPVSEGACKFSYKGKRLDWIACGLKIDLRGIRSVAIVAFKVTKAEKL